MTLLGCASNETVRQMTNKADSLTDYEVCYQNSYLMYDKTQASYRNTLKRERINRGISKEEACMKGLFEGNKLGYEHFVTRKVETDKEQQS